MTDRTCGGVNGTLKCAWWRKNRDGWQTISSGETEGTVAVSSCEHDNCFRLTDAGQSCRNHSATRGWDIVTSSPLKVYVSDDESVNADMERLKARCREARELLEDIESLLPAVSEQENRWYGARNVWLEASDDE